MMFVQKGDVLVKTDTLFVSHLADGLLILHGQCCVIVRKEFGLGHRVKVVEAVPVASRCVVRFSWNSTTFLRTVGIVTAAAAVPIELRALVAAAATALLRHVTGGEDL